MEIYERYDCFSNDREMVVFFEEEKKDAKWQKGSDIYTYMRDAEAGDIFYAITHDDGYVTNEDDVIRTFDNKDEAIEFAKSIKAVGTPIAVVEEEVKYDGIFCEGYVEAKCEVANFDHPVYEEPIIDEKALGLPF